MIDAPTATLIVGLTTTIINLFGIGLNLFFSIRLKNKDLELASSLKELEPKINSLKIKEEKKIIVYEEIFDIMNNLTLWMPYEDNESLIENIKKLQYIVNNRKLYMDGVAIELCQRYCDYCSLLITQPSRKDVANEQKMLDEFVVNFQK